MNINDAYRIIFDDSKVMLQIVASLTDDPWGIIYSCNMFTGHWTCIIKHLSPLIKFRRTFSWCVGVIASHFDL
jgi:hypothetical protein